MNKDQFYRLCHISKSTALHLLKSGKVPCEWTGKKTRCYKIKKEDVRAYLEERAVYPELYSAPRGWVRRLLCGEALKGTACTGRRILRLSLWRGAGAARAVLWAATINPINKAKGVGT